MNDHRKNSRDGRSRREPELTLDDAIRVLGPYGQELAESLAWCESRGMDGLARFYLDEIEYRARRVRRPRRRPERRDDERIEERQ